MNIPVFIPHLGCENECVFCNQRHITGAQSYVEPSCVRQIVESHVKTMKTRTAEIAFFGGSFTGLPLGYQCELLEEARRLVVEYNLAGIRISTRPDYIDMDIINTLRQFGVTTVELGAQSMDENVLLRSKRGHTVKHTIKAAGLIKKHGFTLGLQMMVGLPGCSVETCCNTAERLCKLHPDFVRIYPTLVLKDTPLCDMFRSGEYEPLPLSEAVSISSTLMLLFIKKGINVIRIGLQASDSLENSYIAGPYHSGFGELVKSVYYKFLIEETISKQTDKINITVSKRYISKILGNKKCNLNYFRDNYGVNLSINANEDVDGLYINDVLVTKILI